jgi:hypothetical protein
MPVRDHVLPSLHLARERPRQDRCRYTDPIRPAPTTKPGAVNRAGLGQTPEGYLIVHESCYMSRSRKLHFGFFAAVLFGAPAEFCLTAANGLADDYSEYKNSVMLRVPGLARLRSGRCRIGELRRPCFARGVLSDRGGCHRHRRRGERACRTPRAGSCARRGGQPGPPVHPDNALRSRQVAAHVGAMRLCSYICHNAIDWLCICQQALDPRPSSHTAAERCDKNEALTFPRDALACSGFVFRSG